MHEPLLPQPDPDMINEGTLIHKKDNITGEKIPEILQDAHQVSNMALHTGIARKGDACPTGDRLHEAGAIRSHLSLPPPKIRGSSVLG
jgi:hypothetical protein